MQRVMAGQTSTGFMASLAGSCTRLHAVATPRSDGAGPLGGGDPVRSMRGSVAMRRKGRCSKRGGDWLEPFLTGCRHAKTARRSEGWDRRREPDPFVPRVLACIRGSAGIR
jgi:hypothetical protein